MADSANLSKLLNDEEYNTISDDIKIKINQYIKSKTDIADEFKSKYERIRVNSEQQYFELEKQLIYTKSKLHTEADQRCAAEKKFSDLDARYKDLVKKLRQVEENKEDTTAAQLRANKTNELLEADKRELSQLLDKKNREIEVLNGELKALTDKMNEANNLRCEAVSKLDEVAATEVSFLYKEKRFDQERQQMEQQIAWLNKELQEKCTELINVRKEKAGQQLTTEVQLEERNQENKILRDNLESLKVTSKEQEAKIEDLISRLKDSRESHLQIDEHYNNELTSQKKLAELYKDLAEQGDAQIREYTSAMEELQRINKETKQTVAAAQSRNDDLVRQHDEELSARDSMIEALKIELKNANDLIVALKASGGVDVSVSGIDDLCPTAAATSRILNSGMTLTEIYSEYVQAASNLELEKDENKRLNSYLDQILQEIQERAPILKQQREDYETSLNTISNMTQQLNSAMVDREKLQLETDEIRRKLAHSTRERNKLVQQTADLGQQVRYLVKEIEELRGGRVVWEDDTSSSEVSSSSQLISEKLVTFRSICELQEQNQKLLEVVRDLTEKNEKDEREATDARTRELRQQVENLRKEVEELNTVRRRQAEMVESIVRQRDMYRVLLSQSNDSGQSSGPSLTSTPLPGSSAARPPPATPAPSSGTDVADITLQETMTALTEYKAKYETFRQEKNENERLLNEQLNAIREELNKFRVQSTKLTSELEFSNERYKVLQGNSSAYKKEADAQRDKSLKYSAAILKHEQTINTLREDVMRVQQERNQFEVQIQQFKLERDLAKKNEERLLREREAVFREKKAQNLMLANLQAIKNNMERAEFEAKAKLTNQLERQEGELNSLRRKLNSDEEQHLAAMRLSKSEMVAVRGELEKEVEKRQDALKQLVLSQTNEQDLKRELSAVESKLGAVETQLARLRGVTIEEKSEEEKGETNEEAVKDLQMQLEQSKNEALALRSQIGRMKEQIEQYKNVAMAVEKSITDQNEASKQFQETLQKQMEEMQHSKDAMKTRMVELEKEKLDLISENSREVNKLTSTNAELRTKVASLQTELQETIEKYERASVIETAARADTQAQADVAAEAQAKYERELMLHNADVEALTAIKMEMAEYGNKLQTAEQQATSAKAQLFKLEASWKETERVLLDEKTKLEERCEELTAQNVTLHEQMEKLTSDVVDIQEKIGQTAGSEQNESVTDDAAKSSQQLLEVIKFLRRERQICDTKRDVLQSECNRIRQKCEYAEKRLDHTEQLLSDERNRSQVNVQTAAQHAELMRKVENVALLTDSNKLLREERDALLQSSKQSDIKIKKFEGEMAPLRAENRELKARVESFTAQRVTLQGETERWRVRTNQLIEQANRTDPDEQKRLLQERDNLRRQIAACRTDSNKRMQEKEELQRKLASVNDDLIKSSANQEQLKKSVAALTEENVKQKTEMSKLTSEVHDAQTVNTESKQEIDKLKDTVTNLTAEVTKMTEDGEEKNKTINQLKKIGRKYKDQAEKSGKDMEELKTELSTLRETSTTQPQTPADDVVLKLSEAEQGREALVQKVAELETQQAALRKKVETADTELAESRAKLDEMAANNSEFEKKQDMSRKILQTARVRMAAQKEELEKCTAEKMALEQEVTMLKQSAEEADTKMRLLTSQCEEQTKELTELRQSSFSAGVPHENTEQIDALHAMNAELSNKIQQLQKQLESQTSAPGTPTVAPADRSSGQQQHDAPRMANIRPMSTPTGTVRHSAPVQPVPMSALSVKATASIRPMAITPGVTPTATVMPTTAVSQENVEPNTSVVTTMASSPSVASASRPSQQIQRVAPQIELHPPIELQAAASRGDDSSDLSRIESTTSHLNDPPPLSASPAFSSSSLTVPPVASIISSAVIQPSTSSVTSPSAPIQPISSPSATAHITLPVVSTNQMHASTTLTTSPSVIQPSTSKRQRESTPEIETEPPHLKRTKMADNVVVPQIMVTDEGSRPLTRVPTDESTDGGGTVQFEPNAMPDIVHPDVLSPFDWSTVPDTVRSVGSSDGDDVIVLSDEEGGDADVVEYEDEEEDDDDEDESDYYAMEEGDEEDERLTDDDRQVDDEQQVTSSDAQDESGPTLRSPSTTAEEITGDGGDIGAQTDQVVNPLNSASASTQHQPDRLLPSRQQFPPFTLATQTSQFEDGDDCTVPSTPTLCVPRRTDGFAEAVSSPQVSQSFVFGSGANDTHTSSTEPAQLATQALGVDNMELSLGEMRSLSRSAGHEAPQSSDAPAVVEPTQSGSPVLAAINIEEQDNNQIEFEGDLGEEDESLGDMGMDDTPAHVSSESQDGIATSDDSHITSTQATAESGRPHIQRIVWDNADAMPIPDTTPPPVVTSQSDSVLPRMGQVRARRSRPILRVYYDGGRGTLPRTMPPQRGRMMQQRSPLFRGRRPGRGRGHMY